jgi:hypothetical protein
VGEIRHKGKEILNRIFSIKYEMEGKNMGSGQVNKELNNKPLIGRVYRLKGKNLSRSLF